MWRTPLSDILTQSVRTPKHNQQQKHVTVWESHTCAKVSAEPQMIHCSVCVTQFSLAPVPGSIMFWLGRLFNEKEQWQITSQADWDEENEEESQGVQYSLHLFVKRYRDLDSEGTAAEMPPTKMWQPSGMGHQSKEDSKGPTWVEEIRERQQIPITHIIKSGACRYLILYRVTVGKKNGKSMFSFWSTQHQGFGR